MHRHVVWIQPSPSRRMQNEAEKTVLLHGRALPPAAKIADTPSFPQSSFIQKISTRVVRWPGTMLGAMREAGVFRCSEGRGARTGRHPTKGKWQSTGMGCGLRILVLPNADKHPHSSPNSQLQGGRAVGSLPESRDKGRH